MNKEQIDTKKNYDKIAKIYHSFRTERYPQGWFYNELLEMPTTLKLLGNVKGKKILDLGCGTGIYSKLLTKKGAKIKGIDISNKMIEIARKENSNVEFIVGGIEKLPYKNNEFDIVLSALVLEHVKNWSKILREVNRVLKKGGLFVFSIENPVINATKGIRYHNKDFRIVKDYFKESLRISKWQMGGEVGGIYMKRYHKTYGTIVKLLVKNGFELVDYEDARPLKKAKKLFPKDYRITNVLPYFCTWKWKKK